MSQLFVFGDSITYGASDIEGGWVTRLRRSLDEVSYNSDQYFEVFNLGVPGNTTVDLLNRFEPELTARLDAKEEAMILFAVGINDSQILAGEHQVEIDSYIANLQELTDRAKKYSQKLSFVGLTPVDETKTEGRYLNESIHRYNQAMRDFCLSQQIPFTDILTTFESQDYSILLDDGLHPNTQGHEFMAKLILGFLEASTNEVS